MENKNHESDPACATAEIEKSYRLLVQEVRDYGIFILDRSGIIRTWNTGAERLKGYRADEIIGKHFSIFYSAADLETGKPQRGLQTALREGRFEDEGYRLRKDGTTFWANVVITALYDDDGKHIGFAKVTRDLTERNLAADSLEQRVEERTAALAKANEELRQASRIKDEFLAMLSHELRTPLTSIYGWINLIESGNLDQAKIAKALDVINRNIKAQTQLIDDLLNVSRIITGNLKINPEWIEPDAFIHAAVDAIRPAALAKRISVVMETSSVGGPVYGDPQRLQQVLWNLLMNAIKFTDKHGEIKIESGRVGSKLQISVVDTGQGISRDFLPAIFDRFSQADSSTTRKHGGLGLGLAIVKHIVELHGGTVMAHSEGLSRGATFMFQLPIPALRPSVTKQESVKAGNLQGVKVLVVEDEQDTRDVIGEALRQYGASVRLASSAAEALRTILQDRPDILVSDIGMPEMDGYELLKRIRSEYPPEFQTVPAVALTAYAGPEDKQKSLNAGYQAHIGKPVSVGDLVNAIASILNKTKREE